MGGLNMFVLKVCIIFILWRFQYNKASDDSRPIFIMVFGGTDSGKHQIITALLNLNTTNPASVSTNNVEILEYAIKPAATGTKLRIIKTADLQDIHGLETDARLLATLEDYLDSHEYLSSSPPDIIVICKDLENEDTPKFIKMIRSIFTLRSKLFRFSNPQWENEESNDVSNLVFAIAQNPTSSIRTSRRKLRELRNSISEYTKFPADNIQMEFVSKDDSYPVNLCSEINNIIMNARPDLELSIRLGYECHGSSGVAQLISNISLVDITHPKAAKKLKILVSVNMNATETEVSLKLQHACNKLTCSGSLATDLKNLQLYLHNQYIFNVSDIPWTDYEIEALYRGLGRKGVNARRLLETAFELKPADCESVKIGHGYSLVLDDVLPTSPFQFESAENVSCIGCLLPRGVECKLQHMQLKQVMKYVSSIEEFLSERGEALGVPISRFTALQTFGNSKPGYTFPESLTKSVYVEFHAFEMEMNNLKLLEMFQAELNSLPKFNSSSRESIATFERLFAMYGSQIVTNLHYGGAIEFILSDSWDLDGKNPLKDIIHLSKTKGATQENSARMMIISGGDSNFYSNDPFIFFSESKGKSLFSRWKDSVMNYPVPLAHTPITLKSLPVILNSTGINQVRISDIAAALTYLQSANFEVDGPEKTLKQVLNTCSDELRNSKSEVAECELATEKLQISCNTQREKCEEINNQITKLRAEKISTTSELNTAKSAVLSKEIDNSRIKSQNAEVEGRINTMELTLQFAREELRKQQGHSRELARMLENRGKK